MQGLLPYLAFIVVLGPVVVGYLIWYWVWIRNAGGSSPDAPPDDPGGRRPRPTPPRNRGPRRRHPGRRVDKQRFKKGW